MSCRPCGTAATSAVRNELTSPSKLFSKIRRVPKFGLSCSIRLAKCSGATLPSGRIALLRGSAPICASNSSNAARRLGCTRYTKLKTFWIIAAGSRLPRGSARAVALLEALVRDEVDAGPAIVQVEHEIPQDVLAY